MEVLKEDLKAGGRAERGDRSVEGEGKEDKPGSTRLALKSSAAFSQVYSLSSDTLRDNPEIFLITRTEILSSNPSGTSSIPRCRRR